MAHNISFSSGKAAFYSLREPAWHGLGQVVEKPVSDADVLKLAQLDWQVGLEPIVRGDMTPIDSHHAVVRSDNRSTLGVVGKGFVPVQNHELIDWLRGLDGFADVTIETAGALGNGETVWALGRCNGLKFDLGDGGFQGYMLLANGHAGNRRLAIMPTTVRVVCQNTLRMAEGVKPGSTNKNTLSTGYILRHTKSIATMMQKVQEAYKQTTDAWKASEEALRYLASKPLTQEAIGRLFVEPFIPKARQEAIEKVEAGDQTPEVVEQADESVRAAAIRMEREKRLNEILASPTCTAPKIRDTLYAGLQAVTEYLTHDAPIRSSSKNAIEDKQLAQKASRLDSNLFGTFDEMKGKAWELALELAK